MQLTEVIALVAGLAGLVAGVGTFLKSRGESRKSNAEANHVTLETASDAAALVERVYVIRLAQAERDIADLKHEREVDRKTIVDLNRQIGMLRQSSEMYSRQISLLRSRLEEVLCILRENKIPLPPWAKHGADDGLSGELPGARGENA